MCASAAERVDAATENDRWSTCDREKSSAMSNHRNCSFASTESAIGLVNRRCRRHAMWRERYGDDRKTGPRRIIERKCGKRRIKTSLPLPWPPERLTRRLLNKGRFDRPSSMPLGRPSVSARLTISGAYRLYPARIQRTVRFEYPQFTFPWGELVAPIDHWSDL